MNKTIVVIGVIILVLVGGGWYIAKQNSKQVEQAKMAQEKATMMVADKNSAARYVVYSKSAFDQAANGRRVLYFYATWCPICQPTDADLKANSSKIPSDVTVLRVNYNDPDTDQEEKDLAKKYAVTYQHTFVQIDAQGKEVTKWNGGQTEELLAKIK